ncbi:hypothetical protein SAMN05192588_1095 [Nonlabens sp. Hel1_33_55]|nr:hypothetical protein SAMN05192588_1095 [Nonlabens sp. Hel1_33_55]
MKSKILANKVEGIDLNRDEEGINWKGDFKI